MCCPDRSRTRVTRVEISHVSSYTTGHCLGSRIRTCDLPRPRRVNNHRYLPSCNTVLPEKTPRDSWSSAMPQCCCGSSRTRTYMLKRDQIYSLASQPIAQCFQLRQGWELNSQKRICQSATLSIFHDYLRKEWELNPHESLTPNGFQDRGHRQLACPSFFAHKKSISVRRCFYYILRVFNSLKYALISSTLVFQRAHNSVGSIRGYPASVSKSYTLILSFSWLSSFLNFSAAKMKHLF